MCPRNVSRDTKGSRTPTGLFLTLLTMAAVLTGCESDVNEPDQQVRPLDPVPDRFVAIPASPTPGAFGAKGAGSSTGLGASGVGPGGLGTTGVGRGGGAAGYGSGGLHFRAKGNIVEMGDHTTKSRPTGEHYTHHGVNPFTLTSEDPVSTFSIDVDTASYTLTRNTLLKGVLPDPASVRVEEFINYQRYSYVPPANRPLSVHMEAMPHPFREGHHVLRVGLQGKQADPTSRSPIHLTFLVDVSGSMSSADKLGLAQRSLHLLTNGLQEQDTVAIATYAGRVARILEPTSLVHKDRIHDAIDALKSGGGTAMSAGIDIAYEMAWEGFVEGHENRVVILSDGDANVGKTSWDELLSQIKGYADKGVTLSTVGFGRGNYQDTLMEQLANHGDGNNAYVDSFEQAQRTFGTELVSTLLTIARDVKVQVAFNPQAVPSYRLIGYENRDIADQDFRNDGVDAGEVGFGHSVTALYDVTLKPSSHDELATVHLRYEAPGANNVAEEDTFAFVGSMLRNEVSQASRDTHTAYVAATFAELLRGSPETGEVTYDHLAEFAQGHLDPEDQRQGDLMQLIALAAEQTR